MRHTTPALTHCPSFELLYRQGKAQAALLSGRRRGGGRGQRRRGKRDKVLDTIDYWLCESVPGWLALGALGSRARLALTASDQVNKVGSRPSRFFTFAAAAMR